MLFSILQYLKYLSRLSFQKSNNPFLNEFVIHVLKNKSKVTHHQKILDLKNYYQSLQTTIPKEDYGAGSRKKSTNTNLSISHLLKEVSISKKNGVLLHHLVKHYEVKKCIELGTSLGFGSAYLSNETNKILSIEGNKELSLISQNALNKVGFYNIKIINAKFDDVLENILQEENTFDLLFIDGNHTEKATIAYFELALKHISQNAIIVFDDINWSIGMNNAWNKITKHPEVKLSIDLFRQGIIFFNKKIEKKEHYTLWH